ncbi:MAG: hypothetical protein EBQ99_06335, partial [Planctomycetes bacterium]|nr:hypothetical protein [Planctomycetota bacterium]
MSESVPTLRGRIREALRRSSVRWLLTVVMTLVVGGAMSPFVVSAVRLDAWRQAMVQSLRASTLEQRDAAAVALLERGEVQVLGETFSSDRLRAVGADLFDRKGRVLDPAMVAEILLAPRMPAWAPTFLVENPLTPLLAAAALLASAVGAIWFGLLPGYLTVVGVTVTISAIGLLAGRPAVAFVATGMAGLVISFVLLMRLLLVLLGGRSGWMAVGQTVVREAVRLRISVGFIVVLLVVLPLIPLFIDPRSPLRYQIQTFMARGLDLAYVCAACLTLTLGCATVAFEIRDRQIWQLMTKPLARLQYLLGKWAGIVALDAVLLVVCGIGIFLFVQWMR